MSHGEPWTDAEQAFLRECSHARIGTDLIAPMLGRSVPAVRMRRSLLGLPAPSGKVCFSHAETGDATVADIKSAVAAHFKIPLEAMASPDRRRRVARPRQVAMFLAREVSRKSYPRIGAMFGGRDHTTAIHACRQIAFLMGEDDDLRAEVSALKEKLIDGNQPEITEFPQESDSSAINGLSCEIEAGA